MTDQGRALLPGILEIVKWSAQYNPQPVQSGMIITGAPARLLERLEEDRTALVAEVLKSLDAVI